MKAVAARSRIAAKDMRSRGEFANNINPLAVSVDYPVWYVCSWPQTDP
jgi:hypothetical protein